MSKKKKIKFEYTDEPKYEPVYKANREWAKDIKFNNHWYHLASIYDDQDFDFNYIPDKNNLNYQELFDFNLVINEKTED